MEISLTPHELAALVLQHRWLVAALEEVEQSCTAGDPALGAAVASLALRHPCADVDRTVAREVTDRLFPALTGGKGITHEQTRESLRAGAQQIRAAYVTGEAKPHG